MKKILLISISSLLLSCSPSYIYVDETEFGSWQDDISEIVNALADLENQISNVETYDDLQALDVESILSQAAYLRERMYKNFGDDEHRPPVPSRYR